MAPPAPATGLHRRIRRQRAGPADLPLDLHRPEQNTASSAAIVCGSGSPNSRKYRRAVLLAPTTQIVQPYPRHGRGSKTPTQGRKKLLREREAYFQLMQQGLSNNKACQVVGINPKTGRRWRNGRIADRKQKVAPPIRPAMPPSGASRYLHENERIYIADRLREKGTIRAIAAELGRSPSTISREIRRNRTVGTRGQWHYRPHAAQARADARRPRPKPGKIGQNPELRAFLQDHLDLRWSPEQICQGLRARFPDRPETHVVQTVYQPPTSKAGASCAAISPRHCEPDGRGASPGGRPSSVSPVSATPW